MTLTYTSTTLSVCTVSGSTVTLVGVGTCSITASQAGNASYTAASPVSQSFTVSQGSQTITFGALSNQNYGVSPISLTGSSNSNLTLTYTSTTLSVCTVSGSTVTVVGVGTCSITASQAGNADYAAASPVSQSFTVSQGSQTITFNALSSQGYSTSPISLTGSSSSGLALTYTSTTLSVCTVSGSAVTLVATGTCSITASQAGNADYTAATAVMRSFTVTQGSQTITFTGPGTQSYGAAVALTGSSTSGLSLIYTSTTPSVCTVSGSTVTMAGTGTCTINAAQPGNADYLAASAVNQSFTVSAAAQTITFGAISNFIFGSAPFALSATSSSSLPIAFSSLTPAVCTVSGSTVTVLAAGTCTISANQAGNADYTAAPTVTQSFSSGQAPQTITFGVLPNVTFGATPFTLSATSSSGLPVTISSRTTSVCTVSGSTLTLVSGGVCTLAASQSGNASYSAATPIVRSFTVTPGTQTIFYLSPGNQVTGTSGVVITAGSSSGLALVFTSNTPAVCAVTANVLTTLGVGTCTIIITQPGNASYLAAAPVSFSFTVSTSNQSISFASLPNLPYGAAPFQLSASSSSGLPVTFSSNTPSVCSVSGSLVTPLTAGVCSITASQAGGGSWDQAAPVTRTFTIAPGPLSITGISLGEIVLGSAVSSTVSARGGLPPYQWSGSGLPPGLFLNPSSGALSGVPSAPGAYTLSISVADSQSPPATAQSSVTLSVFGFSTSSLPGAILMQHYSQTISAAGGAAPYTFSASGVPAGLSLSSSGTLSGIPTTAGSFPFAVQVTDSNGKSFSATVTLVVTSVVSPVRITGGQLTGGIVAANYSASLNASGGVTPIVWSLVGGALPPGLYLTGSSAVIQGLPKSAGTYSFTLQATDSNGTVSTAIYSIVIAPASLTLSLPSSFPIGIAGVDYPEQILAVGGGSAPYAFAVTGSWPAGLTLSDGQFSGVPTTAGSYSFTITATDANGQTASAQSSIVIQPPHADLVISQSMIPFSITIGSGSVALHATVTVRSSVVQTLLNYSIGVSPQVSWLNVTGGGTTPGTVEITVAPAALSLQPAAAPYQTTISVSCAAPSPCSGSVHTIVVSLQVSDLTPQLSASSSLISFQAVASQAASISQPFGIQNTGGGVLSITAVTPSDAWLSVSGVPDSLAAGPPAFFSVTANPAGIAPGYYQSSILISSSAGSMAVPVSLSIPASLSMSLFPGGAQIQTEAGTTPGVTAGSFQVSVSGLSSASWNAAVLDGAPWLKVNSPTGQASNSAPGSVAFSLDPVLSAALPTGSHYGTIRISSSGVADSPLDFDVVLDVAPAGSPIKPSLSPAGIFFVTTAAASGQTLSQTVQVSASTDTPQYYQAYPYTVDGANWLSISKTVSTVSSSAPSDSIVSVNPSGLAPGVYRGIVSYALSSQAVRSVNVTLLVQPAPPAPDALATPATCTPSSLVPTQIGLVDNFEQPIGWLTPLSVLVLDNCGNPVTNAQVIASFSSDEQPVILIPVDSVSGVYSSAWTPRSASPQLVVTTQVTAPGLSEVSIKVTGQVTHSTVPVLAAAGTLNLFDPVLGAALAPGTAVQIYGANLSTQTIAASTAPLTSSLGGTSVSIGGVTAPLYFVSPEQIDAQIPFTLTPGYDYQVQVNSGGALSTVGSIHLSDLAPGLAVLPSNLAIAQHPDYTLVSETSPAAPGEYITIYLVGLGATDLSVSAGAASPSSPLAHLTNAATVSVDGKPANVSFPGLTPGAIGLYQIDFQVPEGARQGDLTLLVEQGGVQANSAILPIQ